MKIKRKTQISVLTERFLIIRKSKVFDFAVCAECGAVLLPLGEAAIVLDKPAPDLRREIANRTRHAVEATSGALLICCRAAKS